MTKATPNKSKLKPRAPAALLLRYGGSDAPAAQVMAQARARGDLPLVFQEPRAGAPHASADAVDYTLIDPTLAIAPEPAEESPPAPADAPAAGLAYSGFTAAQRAAYHNWLDHPAHPAPAAFQQLLLANAEVRLLEGTPQRAAVYATLRQLAAAPAWHGHGGLVRTLLLASWLQQDGAGLAEWSAGLQLDGALWSILLGCQALLGAPLRADQLPGLARAWGLPAPLASAPVLRLRLDSLQTVLGGEPLAHALAQVGDPARTPLPWRCQHRELRLAFPQPQLRPHLLPLLADMLAMLDAPAAPEAAEATTGDMPAVIAPAAAAPPPRSSKSRQEPPDTRSELERAHIIVEFGASRSDVFAYVLRQAQKQTGFQQIMDENRHLIYRVPFRRSEMRRFWHLWDYIQGWTSTRVYCDGKQLDKWQIYPYSQYLR